MKRERKGARFTFLSVCFPLENRLNNSGKSSAGKNKLDPFSFFGVIAGLLFCALSVSASWAIDATPALEDPELQARYERLASELRCLMCQNQTIADSPSQVAGPLRDELREQLLSGASDEQILQFMVDRYGDFVRFRPAWKRQTWLLWTAPALFLLIGASSVIVIVSRKSRIPVDDDPIDDDLGSQANT